MMVAAHGLGSYHFYHKRTSVDTQSEIGTLADRHHSLLLWIGTLVWHLQNHATQ